jgi:hypothetical protein
MGYHDRGVETEGAGTLNQVQQDTGFARLVATIASATARALGLILILVGVWAAVAVVLEAWTLYSNPNSIEYFANSLERHSGLDHLMASRSPRLDAGVGSEQGAQGPEGGAAEHAGLKLSYIFAWPLVVLLLLLLGKLASWAIESGARLAFHRR